MFAIVMCVCSNVVSFLCLLVQCGSFPLLATICNYFYECVDAALGGDLASYGWVLQVSCSSLGLKLST